ncbi:hypothetical protein EDB19DRAFT_1312309 [Suillus lakei]|nr:hypothetical protein EDB19DRAFT_1312309 [Suillus lakei]
MIFCLVYACGLLPRLCFSSASFVCSNELTRYLHTYHMQCLSYISSAVTQFLPSYYLLHLDLTWTCLDLSMIHRQTASEQVVSVVETCARTRSSNVQEPNEK